jgi:hypothetical protein
VPAGDQSDGRQVKDWRYITHHPISVTKSEIDGCSGDPAVDANGDPCEIINPEVSLELFNPISIAETRNKLKMCFCDYGLEGADCGSDQSFGAHVGFLHIIPAMQQSFTVPVGAPEAPTLSVTFRESIVASDLTVGTIMRAMLVETKKFCGYYHPTANMEMIEDTLIAESLANEAPVANPLSASTLDWKILNPKVGKARVCLCDPNVEGTCEATKVEQYGLHMGFLHVVDTETTGFSYTVPMHPLSVASHMDIFITFLNPLVRTSDDSYKQDNLMIVPFERDVGGGKEPASCCHNTFSSG